MSNKKRKSPRSKLDVKARLLSGNLKISYSEAIQLAMLQCAQLPKDHVGDSSVTKTSCEELDQAVREVVFGI